MIKNKTGKLDNTAKKGQSPLGRTVPSFLLAALCLLAFPVFSFAEGLDPYSFNPRSELRPQEYLPSLLPPLLRRDSTKTLNNLRSAPNPVVVTDEAGNVSVYQGGELKLSIDTKGNKTFYLKGLPHFEKDDRDYLTRTYEYSGARATVKNEWGEVVGYKEFGLGGLLLKELDEKGRHIRSYEYNGRMTVMMIDHLTNSRTLFNNKGKMEREVNFAGATTATYYYYGANGKLSHKIDSNGNKTTYDDKGRQQFVYGHNEDGSEYVSETYIWESMNKYNVVDLNGNTTYVDHDRQRYETNAAGFVTKTYNWKGTKLISSTDTLRNEITFYENGRPIETRYNNDYLVGLWKYDDETGILICKIEQGQDSTAITYYDHGREGYKVTTEGRDPVDLASDYTPPGFNEIVSIVRQYKDTNHSVAPDIEDLLREMAQNNG